MNAHMILPADYDSSGKTKYPVIMKVYGGPYSQQVTLKLSNDFPDIMATNGFIHVMVDGRGTGFKGRKFLVSTSKNLGKVEVEDQISAARYY
jgi:dipeptidyl aminopeptidase/acylaminoacyl peptidase